MDQISWTNSIGLNLSPRESTFHHHDVCIHRSLRRLLIIHITNMLYILLPTLSIEDKLAT